MVNQVSAGDGLAQNGLALDRRTPWHLSNSRSSASPQTPSSIVSVAQGMLYQLPPELLAEVISNLDTDLAQYLTVSREWQAAIERQTFAEIKLNTSERLAEFHEIVAKNRWRRTCLRRVEVIVQLEAYSVEARPRFETAEEHARNNTIFVHWVRAVLKSLALWSEQDRADVGLWLQAQSPSDLLDRQRLRAARMEPETDLLQARFEHSYLYVSQNDLEDLASVNAVTFLLVTGPHRMINPASCSYLAAKLPRLRKAELALSDNEKRYPELRKRNREDFTNSILFWPSSVREFWLEFPHRPLQNERLVPENVLNGADSDLFSARLRDLSQQLTKINLTAMIGRELFWPLEAENSTSLPYWPNLIEYSLGLSGITPAGTWLFEENPAEKDDEPYIIEDSWQDLSEHLQPPVEDRNAVLFRTKAAPEPLRDLSLSAGRAAQRMPRLLRMQLKCHFNRALHDYDYLVDGKTASATWGDIIALEPEKDVLAVWRDAAFYHTGVENGIQFRWMVGDNVKHVA